MSTDTSGPRRGGNLRVTANTMLLEGVREGFHTRLTASAAGTGDAGNITVKVGRLQLKDGATIRVESAQSNAGDITLEVGSLLHLRDSRITTSVARGEGIGGDITIDDITIDPTFVILDNSQIILKSPNNVIDASSESGVSGTVEIDAPDTDISGGISVLPAAFFDASTLLRESCAVRARGPASSFVVVGRGGLPPAPGEGWSSFYLATQAEAPSSLEGAGDSADVLEYDLLAPVPRCTPGVGK